MAEQNTRSGIQLLLKAEQNASQKVAAARKRKTQRLKEAKDEAKREIDNYKKEKEEAYKEHEIKTIGTRGDTESKIAMEADLQLEEMNRLVELNKEKALSKLLSLVVDVQVELHENLRLNLDGK